MQIGENKIKVKMTICLITKTIRMMTIKMKTTRYLIDQERGEIRRHRHSDRRKIIK